MESKTPDQAAGAPIDVSDFRDALACFPSGVVVVTTRDQDRVPRGLTTTAFCSVSADPPMVLVCVDKGSRTLPSLLARRQFVVNFIRHGEHEVSDLFASKSEDKFAGLSWESSPNDLPVLHEHCLAWLECQTHEQIEAGDHFIFVGRVSAVGPRLEEHEPLMYLSRAYGRWAPL